MKKNLRIVSAAAAALLAVAPVAASSVASVSAATPSVSQAAQAQPAQFTLADKDIASLKDSQYNGKTEAQFVQGLINPPKLEIETTNGNTKTTTSVDASFDSAASNSILINGKTPSTTTKITNGKYTVTTKDYYEVPASTTAGATVKYYVTVGGKKIELKNVTAGANFHFSTTQTFNIGPNVDNNSYFTARDGQVLVNGEVVASPSQNDALFVNRAGNYRNTITIAELKTAIQKVVSLRDSKGNELSFRDNVWAATNDKDLAAQLKAVFGAPVKGSVAEANDATTFNVTNHAAPFKIRVRALSSAFVDITFQNSNAKNTIAPVVYGYYRDFVNGGRSWQPAVSRDGYVRPLVLTQNDLGDGSAWNASNYLRADSNANTKAWINASYDGNVDLTKAGVYNVTVTATNAANQTTKVTVPVIVDALNGHVMTVVSATPVYNINNGVATQATNFTRSLAAGSQIHVYGSVVTAKLNGTDTQFYRIVSNNANYYVPASALKNGVVNTNTNVQTVNKEIKHISTIYDKNGKPTHDAALRAYDKYDFVATPVTINGAKFYQMVENGKPVEKYIKVGNIDGTSRTLKHNSYVYKSNGKAYTRKSGKKTKKVLRRSGSSVTTYGKSFMIAGHQMYRVGHNQYIKKANF